LRKANLDRKVTGELHRRNRQVVVVTVAVVTVAVEAAAEAEGTEAAAAVAPITAHVRISFVHPDSRVVIPSKR